MPGSIDRSQIHYTGLENASGEQVELNPLAVAIGILHVSRIKLQHQTSILGRTTDQLETMNSKEEGIPAFSFFNYEDEEYIQREGYDAHRHFELKTKASKGADEVGGSVATVADDEEQVRRAKKSSDESDPLRVEADRELGLSQEDREGAQKVVKRARSAVQKASPRGYYGGE